MSSVDLAMRGRREQDTLEVVAGATRHDQANCGRASLRAVGATVTTVGWGLQAKQSRRGFACSPKFGVFSKHYAGVMFLS